MAESEGAPAAPQPMFFFIPVGRLVVMSILSGGLFPVYWIYKNFKFLKQTSDADIWPFWRAVFGVLFCHSLLRTIHDDFQANEIKKAKFAWAALATGWVAVMVIGNVVPFLTTYKAGLIGFFIQLPAFLFLAPVQQYINSINVATNPAPPPYHRWSVGHIVCLVYGVLVWLGVMIIIAR